MSGFIFESLSHDLRYALRQLRKNPGFSFTAILVLGLGVAASVAIFAFVDAALLQPLPYREPSRLISVYESLSDCRECELSYQDYLDWKKHNTVFSSLEAWQPYVNLWKSPAGVQALRSARVSGGFFRALGAAPILGRGFTEDDDTPGAPRAVLLMYGTWQARFNGRQDIVGQTIILDGAPYTVIGVLPREFHFALRAAEFWTTFHDLGPCQETRACHDVSAIARLKDNVSIEAALADTRTIAAALQQQYPDSNKGRGAQLIPLRDALVGDIRPALLLLLTGAGLLQLIACVNVASLLLVRAENRKREMVLRSALGASLGRLVRLYAAEGAVLAAIAMACGLTVAYGVIPRLFQLIPERRLRGLPYFQNAGLHPRTFLFACLISLIAVVLFSVTPVLRLSLRNLRDDLAEGGRAAAGTFWKRFGSNLVAVELAIAMVLLGCAGLLGKSLYQLVHVELNFNPEHIATIEVDTAGRSYREPEQRTALWRRITDRISTLPGVIAMARTTDLPVTCNCSAREFRVVGPWNGEHNRALKRAISPDYFAVLQARRIRGRFFTEEDDQSKPPVVIINRALARRFFADEDPVGKIIGDANLSPKSLAQIVGVVDNIREGDLNDVIEPAAYYPLTQDTSVGSFLAVRTSSNAAAMIPLLVSAIHQTDPEIGTRNEFTLAAWVGFSPAAFLHNSTAWLVGGFAALALLLGIIGLYGVIAYSVSQRTREIGVRMALGAQRSVVYRLILGEAGLVAAIGIAVGLGCAIAAGSLMRDFLFGVQAWDLPTLMAVVVILGFCALLASYLPARRAASVNPVEALRAE
jgi:macrolide transport system ATP-binding/permease protein